MFIKMKECKTVIFFILLKGFSSVDAIPVSSITCGDFCSAIPGSSYTLTCTYSGTPVGIVWVRDGTTVLTCDAAGTTCFPAGYSSGSYPNSTSAIITITSFDSSTDSGIWQCNDGLDAPVSCTLPDVATGNLQGQCTVNGNSHDISCSGITSHGSPAVTLELKNGGTIISSTTSGGSVSTTQTDAGGKNYTCEVTGIAGTCLSTTSVPVTCEVPSPGTTLPPTKSPACLCQCACTCEQASRIVLIIIIIVLVIVVVAIIAFIVVFCVKHIKTYNDHYRLVIFIVAIVVFIVAVACTIVVFVLAPPVEKPQVEGQDCCCSSCDSDGEKNKGLCNDLKLSAAVISILVAVIMLIIITIILIVWICPGKCGTDKLLNLCNKVPESSRGEAGPGGDNNSSGVGTPLNTVTPSEKPKTKPVEKNTTDAGGNKKGSSKVSISEVKMTTTPMLPESPYETIAGEEKKATEEENKNSNETGKEMERNIYVNEPGTKDGMKRL